MGQANLRIGKVSTGAIAAGGVKSAWLLNPVTHRGKLQEVWLSFGAVAAQPDIAFELYRVTSLGSPAGTTATISQDDPNDDAPVWTALSALTTEPTTVQPIREGHLSVVQGLLVVFFPYVSEIRLDAGGARLGCRVVNDGGAAMTAVNMRGGVVWREGI